MRTMLICFVVFFANFVMALDIAVVTLAHGDEYKKIVRPGIENKKQYCQKHNYTFYCGEKSLDPSRPIAWTKVLLIAEIMQNSSHDWIFWTDADSLIMNQAIQLEELIDEDYDLILTKDWDTINTGQFLIRNCAWSRQFLVDVYSHLECILHPWWEQQAVITEIQTNPTVLPHVKILPQRLMNSYLGSPELNLQMAYQRGDFILHFPGIRGDFFRKVFEIYPSQAIDDLSPCTLDHHLGIYGFQLTPLHCSRNEGFVTHDQKVQFMNKLSLHPNIQSVLEIGLNGGHSAEMFFSNCKNLKKFISVDINIHPYVEPAVGYFKRRYKDKFQFLPGDSLEKIPQLVKTHPGLKLDLIYIDGNHTYEGAFQDIVNCKALAHPETILWIDDYAGDVQAAVDACANIGILTIEEIFPSADEYGWRRWVQARYLGD